MIRAIVRVQHCVGDKRRCAFVGSHYQTHGFARGAIKYYEVTAPTWAKIRATVATIDKSGRGRRTMGFSSVNAQTVMHFVEWNPPHHVEQGFRLIPDYESAGATSGSL